MAARPKCRECEANRHKGQPHKEGCSRKAQAERHWAKRKTQ